MSAILPIPPLESATDPVQSSADIGQRWRALMGPFSFYRPLLHFLFVGSDRRFIKVLTEVEVDLRPDPTHALRLMRVIAELMDDSPPDTTVAFLLARPGRDGISAHDRRWAAVLNDCAAAYRVPIEPFFRANDDDLVEVSSA